MYSFYFLPNDNINMFVDEIAKLEESINNTKRHVIITGDFNTKSPLWEEWRLDRRGQLVSEMVASNQFSFWKN